MSDGPIPAFDMPAVRTPQGNLKGMYRSNIPVFMNPVFAELLGDYILHDDTMDREDPDDRCILALGEKLKKYVEAEHNRRRDFARRQQDVSRTTESSPASAEV